jgi:CRP-like cAMP-binding protein
LSHSLVQLVKALDAGQIVFTKQDLSSYLGISPRSLNRLLSQLKIKV